MRDVVHTAHTCVSPSYDDPPPKLAPGVKERACLTQPGGTTAGGGQDDTHTPRHEEVSHSYGALSLSCAGKNVSFRGEGVLGAVSLPQTETELRLIGRPY